MSSTCTTSLVGSQVGQVVSSQVQGVVSGQVVVSPVCIASVVGSESIVGQGVSSQVQGVVSGELVGRVLLFIT